MAFMSKDECKKYVEKIQRIVAEPHSTLTQHDRYRAIALIMFMRPKDISLHRYIHINMTDEDKKAVDKISETAFK